METEPLIGSRPRRWKVPQPPIRRGSWKGTGRRMIGEVAGHEIHLEIEDARKKKKKKKLVKLGHLGLL